MRAPGSTSARQTAAWRTTKNGHISTKDQMQTALNVIFVVELAAVFDVTRDAIFGDGVGFLPKNNKPVNPGCPSLLEWVEPRL